MSSHRPLPERTQAVRSRRREALIGGLRAALAGRPQPGVRAVRLFGSWARGDFDGMSDVDLLVVTDGADTPFDTLHLPRPERVDTVVVAVDRLDRYLAEGHGFYTRIMGESVPLYPPPAP